MNSDQADQLIQKSSLGKDWKVSGALPSKRGRLYRLRSGQKSKRILRVYDVTNQMSDQGLPASLLRQSSSMMIRHPRIIPIHSMEMVADKGVHYLLLTMEEAVTDLKSIIDDSSHLLTSKEKVAHLYHLLQGLAYLHDQNMVHRKINPSNMLLTKKGLKCGDVQDLSLYSHHKGKHAALPLTLEQLAYTAPELLLGHLHHKPASDMWSFGTIMHEMLLGNRAFEGKTADDVVGQIFKRLGTFDDVKEFDAFNFEPISPRKFKQNLKEDECLYGFSPKQWNAAIDLMDKCLTLKAGKRITAKEALKHPLFQMFGYSGKMEKDLTLKPPSKPKVSKDERVRMLRSQWIRQGVSDIQLGHTTFHIVAHALFLFDTCLHLFDYESVEDFHSVWCSSFLLATKLLGDVKDDKAYDSLIGLICGGKNEKVLANEYHMVNFLKFHFFHVFLLRHLPVKLGLLNDSARKHRSVF